MASFVSLLLCITLAAVSTSGLYCSPCVVSERCPNSVKPGECPYGIVTDVCNCCFVCGQGPGDKCGGPWNFKGKCGIGLECVSPQAGVYGFEGTCEAAEDSHTTKHHPIFFLRGLGDKCGGLGVLKEKCGTGLECVSPQADLWRFEGICKAVEDFPTTEKSPAGDADGNTVEPTEETTTAIEESLIVLAIKHTTEESPAGDPDGSMVEPTEETTTTLKESLIVQALKQ